MSEILFQSTPYLNIFWGRMPTAPLQGTVFDGPYLEPPSLKSSVRPHRHFAIFLPPSALPSSCGYQAIAPFSDTTNSSTSGLSYSPKCYSNCRKIQLVLINEVRHFICKQMLKNKVSNFSDLFKSI